MPSRASASFGFLFALALAGVPSVASAADDRDLASLRRYIFDSWVALTRSNAGLLKAAPDAMIQAPKSGAHPRPIVYIPPGPGYAGVLGSLQKAVGTSALALLDLQPLPADADHAKPGLLYLPKPYVVPGGRFNELYGWDSYFVVRGLLADGRRELARSMADDLLFEVSNYGKVLNANRSYYLTRSQPPLLSKTVLAVYETTRDKRWLARAVAPLESYYRYWTQPPHLVPSTGLSRYFDEGNGPVPESVAGERDAGGGSYYSGVKEYFKSHQIPGFDLKRYYDVETDALTPLYYKNDRSMRESGFDASGRFGPFNAEIIDFNPVCLNSLLYGMEKDMAAIERALGRKVLAAVWERRAEARRKRVDRLLWNGKTGLYEDYDFVDRRLRRYPFLSTFYPLWTGLADRRRAARVAANLPIFERPGGLLTSSATTGDQWDAPFGWAPLEMIAVEGLRRYGYTEAADRISVEFLSMILESYLKRRALMEKYDVERRSASLDRLKFGYHSNEIGFGWTNAVFEILYERLPPKERRLVLK